MSLKPTAQGVIIPTTSVQMNPTTSKGRLPLPMKKKTNALKYDKQSDKRSTDLTQFVQPISITVDTFKNDSDVYLAFSLHYFNDATAARENTVKFMKMSSLEIDPVLILHEIRYSANEYCAKKIRFPSLVTSNPEIAQYFHEVGIIDRSYDCYFSHITKFADELLKIPEFEIALDVLENFFMGVKNDNNFQMQIQKYFIANKTHFDFPKIQLKKMDRCFGIFVRCFTISPMDGRIITSKSCLNSSVKELSKSDSYVSQVIPQLVRIQKLILKDLGNETLSKQLEAAFLKTLDPLLHGYQNGIYDLATFLDPRYSLETDILSYDKWQELAEFTKNYIMNSSIGSRLSNREKKSKIDVEMYNFQSIVKKQRPATHPFNWWKVYSKRFAFLYDVAKTFITPPPCAIDVQQYFGANGKYIRNESKLPLKQFNNNLMIAASLETFRGRGYTDKYNELEPIAINQGLLMNIHQAVKTPVIKRKNIDTSNAIVSVTQSYIIQTSNPAPASAPVLPNAETLDPDEGFDLSKYLMQPPDVKQEQFNEIGLSAEVKPESLLIPSNEEDLVDVKPERIEITPSTSTATHVKPKSIYVSTLGASPTYTREIQRAADKRVFIKVPVEEQPTNVSIDFVPSTSGQPRQVKRTYDSVPTTQGIVIESKKRYKRVCTNFETENGVICKERIYPFSTPTSLESITIARPQKIRNTPTGIYPNADL
ncbi:unnamed protein product [Caenorhabditis angaria]|uniref:HAT C-terminal dimerisation domain-containing protein n=1 Tax=Caenorhabditis angaria TaxID=860376 RepID=A0A9P1IP10_9PELO|nr:unnamed protein product [Caenorhabditis angaria]